MTETLDYAHLSPIERTFRQEQADKAVEAYLACTHCTETAVTRGLCRTHYQQARRGGYLNDYPIAQIYERGWVEDMLPHILAIHGESIVEDALAVHRLQNADVKNR